jgi:CheY-like chemotaxis protein
MNNDDIALAADSRFAKAAHSQGSVKLAILLVEDEPDQALLVQDALSEDNRLTLLPAVQSGEAAIAYLSGEGAFADRVAFPFPFLVLLDLHMPGIGGLGVCWGW